MSGDIIDYEVVACSSEDKELQKSISNKKEYHVEGNKVCLVTERNRNYPQSLTIQLDKAQHVGRIDIVVHPKYLPSTITVAFGMPDSRFSKNSNKSNGASYTIKGTFNFVEAGGVSERQSLYTDDPALYVRFTAHGFYDSPDNEDRQICIAAIVISRVGRGFEKESNYPYSRSPHRDDFHSRSITSFRNPSLHGRPDSGSLSSLTKPRPASRNIVSPYIPKNAPTQDVTKRTPSPSKTPLHLKTIPRRRAVSASPMPRATIHLEPSDSEDEEVIFTKSMVTRLNRKLKENGDSPSRPSSSVSMTSSNKTAPIDTTKGTTTRVTPIKEGRRESVTIRTPMKSSEDSKSVSSDNTVPSVVDEDTPITPRTRDRILKEIAGVELEGSMRDGESVRDAEKRRKKYYFRRSMNVYNNTLRILETRKEETLWKEEYDKAEEISQQLQHLYSKEAPLRELLVDRLDALNAGNYKKAQQLKDTFDAQLEDTVDLQKLQRFFTKQEMQKMKEMQQAAEEDLQR